MLDAGSASGGGTCSGDRSILWLFNAQEGARVSCVLMQQHALNCVQSRCQIGFWASQLSAEKTPSIMLNRSLNAFMIDIYLLRE